MRYYIADTHFFHRSLNEKMDQRGFDDIDQMNEYMIDQWNSKVRKMMRLLCLVIFHGEMQRKQQKFWMN